MNPPKPASEADLRSAALWYADRGRRVFPVHHKVPLPGSHGFQDASVDPTVIDAMRWSEATGVAIATGEGLLAIDCDPRNGSEKSLAALTARHGPLPVTATVQTGGGGTHYYYTVPPAVRVASRSNALGP